MSTPPPAPMSGHFFWSDGTETHITNLFTNFASVPKKGFLIGVFRYINPITLQELEPKAGHWIGGKDYYYFSIVGNGSYIELAMWDGKVTGGTRVIVYELRGYGVETYRSDVRASTFPSQRIWNGVLVSDQQWENTRTRASEF